VFFAVLQLVAAMVFALVARWYPEKPAGGRPAHA